MHLFITELKMIVNLKMDGANKNMIEHASSMGFLLSVLYGVTFTLILFLQDALKKAQIEVSDGALLPVAFFLTLFSGVLSYVIFLKEKHEKIEFHNGFIHIGSSLLVAIILGFGLSGLVSTNHLLLAMVIGAFFKDLCLFAFRKATQKKLKGLADNSDS